MKRYAVTTLILMMITSIFPGASIAMSGREVMEKVEAAPMGKDFKSIMEMSIVDSRGMERRRKVMRLWKDYGDMEKAIVYFKEPVDMAGSGTLIWSYDDPKKDDRVWLYLTALKKVRRISARNQQTKYFMGTDFTYEDLGGRNIEEDTYKLLREEKSGQYDCHVVQCTPKDRNYIYSKRVVWVIKDTWRIARVDFFDRDDKLLKQLHIIGYKEVDGIWTPAELNMKNVRINHSTQMKLSEVKYNQGLKDDLFSERSLKRGYAK